MNRAWLAVFVLCACGDRTVPVNFHVPDRSCPKLTCVAPDGGCPFAGVSSVRLQLTRLDTGEDVTPMRVDMGPCRAIDPPLCTLAQLRGFEFTTGVRQLNGLAVTVEGFWGQQCKGALYFSCQSVGPVDLQPVLGDKPGIDLYCNGCSPLACVD